MIRRLVPLLVTLLVLGALAWTMYFLYHRSKPRAVVYHRQPPRSGDREVGPLRQPAARRGRTFAARGLESWRPYPGNTHYSFCDMLDEVIQTLPHLSTPPRAETSGCRTTTGP
jgi:hypothetical protein